jgi:hypothetical protein
MHVVEECVNQSIDRGRCKGKEQNEKKRVATYSHGTVCMSKGVTSTIRYVIIDSCFFFISTISHSRFSSKKQLQNGGGAQSFGRDLGRMITPV